MEAMNMTFSDPVDLENILSLAEPTNIPSTTIKMEDLEASSSQDPTVLTSQPETSSLSSASADSKSQPKKRKSWGQELPEPKTNLPPRKRAKTADEKEQRRIERVKRNRLAAHNSRERKRQEVDELQKQLDMHKAEIHHLQSRVQLQSQALHYYQSKYPGVLPAPYMMAFQPQAPEFMSQNPLLQQSSMGYQNSIVSNSSPSTSPGLPPSMTDTPDSLLKTLDSPATSGSQPATPHTEMHSLFTSTTAPNPCKKVEQTQHSAASIDFPHGFGINTPSYDSSFHLSSNLQSHHLFAPTHDFELFGAGADDLLSNVPNPLPLDSTPLLSSYVGPDVHETGIISASNDFLEDMHTASSSAHPVCDEPGTAALFEEFLAV